MNSQDTGPKHTANQGDDSERCTQSVKEKRRINARAFAADVKALVPDCVLASRHNVTRNEIRQIKLMLVKKGILTQEDITLPDTSMDIPPARVQVGRASHASTSEKFLDSYRQQLATSQAQQIRQFVRAFPERSVHPEIWRQLQYLQDTEYRDALVVSTIQDLLQRFTAEPRYWEGLTDVQVARNWHYVGLLYARENGIKTGQIRGPLDAKTCDVCRHMLGSHVNIRRAINKFNRLSNIQDPKKYAKAWRFPTLDNVDNQSREELQKKLLLPPFCPGCRHSIGWLY